MPRKSAAAIAMPVIDVTRTRIEPPPSLSAPVREIFREVVGSVDAQHLRPCDVPTVETYCEAVHLARTAAAQIALEGAVIDGRASAWVGIQERAHRSVASLGRALRLTPHSRADRRTAGTSTRPMRRSIYEQQGDSE